MMERGGPEDGRSQQATALRKGKVSRTKVLMQIQASERNSENIYSMINCW